MGIGIARTKCWQVQPDPTLEMTVRVMANQSERKGSSKELAEILGVEMKPNVLTRHLNVKADELKMEHEFSTITNLGIAVD